MRLLITTDTVGGVWTFTKELAGGLLAGGCEVTLVSLGILPSPGQKHTIDELSAMGTLHYIAYEAPLEWMPRNHLAYASAERLLLQLCRDFRPDALLLSQYCFGALPVRTAKIIVAHSDVLSWAQAAGKAPLADDPWLRTYHKLVQDGLDGSDLLIAPTRATLEDMNLHFRLPRKTAVVPNGRTLLQHAAAAGARQLCAVTAGRMWDPAKSLSLLRNLESPMPILVAGEQNQDTAVTCCTMLGYQNESALLALFHESAIYLCCSSYEPFGLAPLEAALCGCAIVANAIPTLREVWGDGALYFDGSAKDLTRLLHALSEHPEDLATAQRRSMERAQRYSTARMTEGYLQQVNTLLTARAGAEAFAA